jgi:hypothetical protein
LLAVRKESERLKRFAAPLMDRFGSSATVNPLIYNINMHSPVICFVFLLFFFVLFGGFVRGLFYFLMISAGYSERERVSE